MDNSPLTSPRKAEAVDSVLSLETSHAAAEGHRDRGLAVGRLIPGSKQPLCHPELDPDGVLDEHGRVKRNSWSARSAEPDEFRPSEEPTVLTGFLSSGGIPGRSLVCIDLDLRQSRAAACRILVVRLKLAAAGRESAPFSRLYAFIPNASIPSWAVMASKNTAAWRAADRLKVHPGPCKMQTTAIFEDGKGRRIELLATGQHTPVYPAHHPSGEQWKWETPDGQFPEIPEIGYPELAAALVELADAAGVKWLDFGEPVGIGSDTTSAQPKPARPVTSNTLDAQPAGIDPALKNPADTPQTEEELCKGWEPWVEPARGYVAQMELPRTGHGGNAQTCRIVAALLIDFALPRTVAWEIFQDKVNFPLTSANDAWDDGELARIFDRYEAERPTSPRLKSKRKRETPRKWDDPAALADKFLSEHHYHFLRDTPFEYVGGVYRPVSDGLLKSQVGKLFEREAAADYERRLKKWNDDGHGRTLGEKRAERDDLEAGRNRVGEDTGTGKDDDTDDGEEDGGAKQKAKKKPAKTKKKQLTKAEDLALLDRRISDLEKAKPKAVKEFSRSVIDNVITASAVRCQLPDDTDFNIWLDGRDAPQVLSVRNGLLVVETGELLPHDPAWFSVTQLPVEYDPAAPLPEKWLAFLLEVLEGDADRIAVIQEMIGAILLPHVTGKWFALFIGEGNNGKSVVLNLISYLVGEENTSAVTFDMLTASRFASAALAGKLANVIGDQGPIEVKDVGWIKMLTGSDKLPYEKKNKDVVFVRNTAKLLAACNEMPVFNDRSDATWKRLIAFPFNFTVPKERIAPRVAVLLEDAVRRYCGKPSAKQPEPRKVGRKPAGGGEDVDGG
jgi:P4 family phage/plasmid primase-like protien